MLRYNTYSTLFVDECTFFIRGQDEGRKMYVLPSYRSEGLSFSLKAWEPENPDTFTIHFLADDGFKSKYILHIGDISNEKVSLFYESETEGIQISRVSRSYFTFRTKIEIFCSQNYIFFTLSGKTQIPVIANRF